MRKAWNANTRLLRVGAAALVLVPLTLACRPPLAAIASRPPVAVLKEQPATASSATRAATELSGAGRLVELPIRANLLGASWAGTGDEVDLRARGAAGGWSGWQRLHADADEGPDHNSAEAGRSNRRQLAVPIWVGDADLVQVRGVHGSRVHDVRIVSINTTGTATASARAVQQVRSSAAAVLGTGTGTEASAGPPKPAIITRAQWGADESIRRADPIYASKLAGAVVHHTVSSNSYAPQDAAALIRGIYVYHVRSNGWNDIGYNFLVDRYGQVLEGRGGGVSNAVVGAHTAGFNTATAGIALLGRHDSETPTTEAQTALTGLLAWRLDQAHVDPTGNMTLRSAGSSSHAAGQSVTRRAVAGHRDLFATACPGALAYGLIDAQRSAAWAAGGPKFAGVIVEPRVNTDGTAAGATISAHGREALDYLVTLRRASDNATIATLTASTQDLAVDWPGTSAVGPVPATDVRWTIEASAAGVAATPAYGALVGLSPPVQLSIVTARPAIVAPNGDGLDEQLRVTFSLSARARVRAQVVAAEDYARVLGTIWTGRSLGRGRHTLAYGGLLAAGAELADGAYALRLVADDPVAGRIDPEVRARFELDRSLAFLSLPPAFSPNGDGVLDTLPARVLVRGAARELTVGMRSRRGMLYELLRAPTSGARTVALDGRSGATTLADGRYDVEVALARTGTTPLLYRRAVTIDRRAPALTARRRAGGLLYLRLSERSLVTGRFRIRGRLVTRRRYVAAGRSRTRAFGAARTLLAVDLVGNRTRVLVRRR